MEKEKNSVPKVIEITDDITPAHPVQRTLDGQDNKANTKQSVLTSQGIYDNDWLEKLDDIKYVEIASKPKCPFP